MFVVVSFVLCLIALLWGKELPRQQLRGRQQSQTKDERIASPKKISAYAHAPRLIFSLFLF
jgi:hypothetical protein